MKCLASAIVGLMLMCVVEAQAAVITRHKVNDITIYQGFEGGGSVMIQPLGGDTVIIHDSTDGSTGTTFPIFLQEVN